MQPFDIWQALGSPQIAEITNLINVGLTTIGIGLTIKAILPKEKILTDTEYTW